MTGKHLSQFCVKMLNKLKLNKVKVYDNLFKQPLTSTKSVAANRTEHH